MAYEKLEKNIPHVTLGGVDKTTGKKNQTVIEGYYLGSEDRPNKYNPGKPQKFYIFKTQVGVQGVYGKAGIDKLMKKAVIGRMTKLWPTGETLNTGKGNPMVVYDAQQDRTDVLSAEDISDALGGTFDGAADLEDQVDDTAYESLDSDEDGLDEITPPRAQAPRTPAASPSADRQARVQAMLNKSRTKTA